MFEGKEVSLGRRVAALSVDWGACYAIALGFNFPGKTSLTVLAIFFTEVALLTAFGGASFGHRLMGMKVVRFSDGGVVTPLQALIRTLLLCTVVFAVTYDENGRGIHERLSNTYLIRA